MRGSNPKTQRNQEITINVKQDGNKFVRFHQGSARLDQVSPKGKVDGDNNSFVVNLEFIGNKTTQSFKGTISDCEINFSREDGGGDS